MANVSEHTGTRTPARREQSRNAIRPFETGTFFSPFALLRDMTQLMDQIFEGGGDMPIRRGERMWAPAVEVRETDGNLIVCADLPGIDQKDVKVEVDEGMLVIQGERKREQKEEREGYRRSEVSYGSFYRTIPLPENAKIDQAKADFHNGVLEITIPEEKAQSHRRQIPVGQGQEQGQIQGQSEQSSRSQQAQQQK